MFMDFEEDIKNALKTLREGGVILYPTDTVWGLGCDATNNDAVEKIFRIKARSDSKSLIILAESAGMVERYVKDVPEIALELIDVTDTPLTIIYPEAKNLAPAVSASDGSVGIRVCMDEFCNELIKRFRKPIVSTSANISGDDTPSCFEEISEKITEAVDYTVEYKKDNRQKYRPSPVIKIEQNGVITIIRK
jgi:L-threonylcarbamoyladenylate synthase